MAIILASFDVVNLIHSIPTKDVIKLVKHSLEETRTNPFNAGQNLNLLSSCVHQNYLKLNDNICKHAKYRDTNLEIRLRQTCIHIMQKVVTHFCSLWNSNKNIQRNVFTLYIFKIIFHLITFFILVSWVVHYFQCYFINPWVTQRRFTIKFLFPPRYLRDEWPGLRVTFRNIWWPLLEPEKWLHISAETYTRLVPLLTGAAML